MSFSASPQLLSSGDDNDNDDDNDDNDDNKDHDDYDDNDDNDDDDHHKLPPHVHDQGEQPAS